MDNYRINRTSNGNPNNNHEIHNEKCPYFSLLINYEDLGRFYNCKEAIREAKNRLYTRVDGCKVCCKDCHNQ